MGYSLDIDLLRAEHGMVNTWYKTYLNSEGWIFLWMPLDTLEFVAPHVTEVVSVPLSGMIFPLKRRYDRVNFTLEEDPGDEGEDGDFQFPDGDGGVDASLREDDDVPAESGSPTEPRYAVDKRGRRHPIDEYGNRITPGNRRPPGFPIHLWNKSPRRRTTL